MTGKDQQINKKLGRVIAKKRKAAGFTQEEVAEELGIGNEALSRIERGINGPSVDKLYVMAGLFRCGVETFLIEGSRRPTDQAEHLAQLLRKLSPEDRALVVSLIERLARRLAKTKAVKDDNDGFLI